MGQIIGDILSEEQIQKRKAINAPSTRNARITAACDGVLANCYPYWEGCHIDYPLLYMKEMDNKAVRAANGKQVFISETGGRVKALTLEPPCHPKKIS